MTRTRSPSGAPRSSAKAATTSTDTSPSRLISWRASSPIPGWPKPYRAASTMAATNRAGSASAASQLSHADARSGRAASQSVVSMVLPAPAGPTTMVSRTSSPRSSWLSSRDRRSSPGTSAGAQNFENGNRGPRELGPAIVVACGTVARPPVAPAQVGHQQGPEKPLLDCRYAPTARWAGQDGCLPPGQASADHPAPGDDANPTARNTASSVNH